MNLRATALTAAAAIGAVMSPAAAEAAVKLGSTAPPGQSQDCFGATLFVQASSAGPSYVVPAGGGVITSWSVHGFGAPAQLTLKTVRKNGPGSYLIRGTSEEGTVAPSGTTTFPSRIPVTEGDEIALWVPGKAPCNYVTDEPGDVQAFRAGVYPEPAVGETFGPTGDGGPRFRLNVSANLEPDADRDGYGDETQDACPGNGTTAEGPCPDRRAPRTTITGAPEAKVTTSRKRVLVRFRFRSSEPATFACTVDRVTKPCASPFRVRVGKGRHTFSVASTDLAGNVDATPARTAFRVVRQRKPRRG